MKAKYPYDITYIYEGVRYTKQCSGYDIDVSAHGCLTMYFNNGTGRIIIPMNKVENLAVTCVWKM